MHRDPDRGGPAERRAGEEGELLAVADAWAAAIVANDAARIAAFMAPEW